jgi:mRNA-degrading endonuclease RelE of RelBE toxin-antitoxin system
MNYTETSIFRKTARRLDAQTKAELVEILDAIQAAESIENLQHIKHMKGGKNKGFYRIRFGNYRLGFFLTTDGDILLREVGLRGDFYKTFP